MDTWHNELQKAQSINDCLKLKQTILDSEEFQKLQRELITASSAEKPILGAQLNSKKKSLSTAVDLRIQEIQTDLMRDTYADFDPSFAIPNSFPITRVGKLHPITETIIDIQAIFSRMGFDVFDGLQVTSQWNNFDSVNVPEFHPARDMQDTFFLDSHDKDGRNLVMRTQATANFAEYAKTHQPPFRVIFPSLTFRNETMDTTHDVNFHQFDMWLVDKNVSLSDLIGLSEYFFREFFQNDEVKVRYRPSFFPFVQPGVETDIFVPNSEGGKWLEVSGSGPIHRDVLRMNGLDPDVWSGIAWGFGIDRLFMIKQNLKFINQIYSGNLKFLQGR